MQWPGYLDHPFDGTISNVKNLTRGELLDEVGKMVLSFVQALKSRGFKVSSGHGEWMIGRTGLKMERFYVARLHHRGGNYFQPEIWAPRPPWYIM